jgi:hypothetical protein
LRVSIPGERIPIGATALIVAAVVAVSGTRLQEIVISPWARRIVIARTRSLFSWTRLKLIVVAPRSRRIVVPGPRLQLIVVDPGSRWIIVPRARLGPLFTRRRRALIGPRFQIIVVTARSRTLVTGPWGLVARSRPRIVVSGLLTFVAGPRAVIGLAVRPAVALA